MLRPPPSSPLADSLFPYTTLFRSHDWLTLLGRRDRAISLPRYRNGYAVPDIRMSFDGAAFEVSAQQYAYRNPDIRFWAGVSEVMDRQTAEAQITTFIVDVLDSLDARNVPGTNAALRWKRVQESRAVPSSEDDTTGLPSLLPTFSAFLLNK